MEQLKHKYFDFWRRAKEVLLPGSADQWSHRSVSGKSLRYEPLEPRIALSGAGLVDFVAQPAGELTGKIVFTSGGHGWQWSDALNRWATDRGDFNEIVEDFGNQDQMTFYADYLLRAGATVVPMRPVGHQLNEVVLDNDSAEVTYAGSWSNSTSSVYYDEDYGAVADSVSYRFSSISATETATATYTPDIPEAGFYPVYTWVLDSGNRTNQLYTINDSAGGVTEIRVDHRMVGKGWVYLGTYHFDAGTSGNVVISNQSTDGGSVVIADAIRFGNGMGDMRDGPNGVGHASGTISGEPREDENSMMWTWRAIGQGNSAASVIGTGNVSAPSRMAEHMNNNSNPFGSSVYIGFHSNGGGGRGAVGLIDVDVPEQTPNQPELALYTGRQINQDMQALNGLFEHNWSTRTTHTFTGEFGEINEGQSAEMDMTIIETAFHDNSQDAQLMRDPKVRDQLARSTYEATLEYFDNFGGLSSPISQPSAPVGVTATADANGDITVSWSPGPTGVQGGTPTGYRVYVSRDGYGFLGYVEESGAGAGSHTFDAIDLDDDTYYFKVVAVNGGGESPRSAVTVARKTNLGVKNVLIVDGFDRNDRPLNERYPYAFTGDGLVDRVRTRFNNSFDYVVQYGAALDGSTVGMSAAQNEAVISGAVTLSDYDAVMWFSGEESTADDTFNGTEQTLVSAYLTGGGKLFVSGAEIGWDLEAQGNGQSFYNNSLRADYVSDDANTYDAQGAAGSIFAGLSFSFDDGTQGFYDVTFPDVISPLGGATTALNYVGGTGGGAAIQYDSGGDTKVVNFGFPFETITTEADRNAAMDRVLDFFGLNVVETGDFDQDTDIDGFDFLAWQLGFGTTGGATLGQGDGNADGNVDGLDLAIWESQYATTPLLAASTSSSAQASLAVTAAETSATPSAASDTDLVGVAQLASLSEEESESSAAAVAESTELVQNVRHQHSHARNQDEVDDRRALALERIRASLERFDVDHQAWQEAFAEIGADEFIGSQLFKV
ncbi:MAG: fibronectin type III domain-containing protein [Aeoliella sp.]